VNPFIPPHLADPSPHRTPSAFHIFILAAASALCRPSRLLHCPPVGGHNGGYFDSRVRTHTPFSADVLIHVYVPRCSDLRFKIQTITDGEYAIAKRDVEQLRAELGQAPLPNLQETLEERKRESVISPLWISPRILIGISPPPQIFAPAAC